MPGDAYKNCQVNPVSQGCSSKAAWVLSSQPVSLQGGHTRTYHLLTPLSSYFLCLLQVLNVTVSVVFLEEGRMLVSLGWVVQVGGWRQHILGIFRDYRWACGWRQLWIPGFCALDLQKTTLIQAELQTWASNTSWLTDLLKQNILNYKNIYYYISFLKGRGFLLIYPSSGTCQLYLCIHFFLK